MKTSKKANKVPLLGVSGHKWEYLVEQYHQYFSGTQNRLNELGANGWELCGTYTNNSGYRDFVFKRMKS